MKTTRLNAQVPKCFACIDVLLFMSLNAHNNMSGPTMNSTSSKQIYNSPAVIPFKIDENEIVKYNFKYINNGKYFCWHVRERKNSVQSNIYSEKKFNITGLVDKLSRKYNKIPTLKLELKPKIDKNTGLIKILMLSSSKHEVSLFDISTNNIVNIVWSGNGTYMVQEVCLLKLSPIQAQGFIASLIEPNSEFCFIDKEDVECTYRICVFYKDDLISLNVHFDTIKFDVPTFLSSHVLTKILRYKSNIYQYLPNKNIPLSVDFISDKLLY